MKILLDENLPHRLRPLIAGHECFTVAFQGWGGIKNGELLSLAASEGFEALLTSDGNLPYQRNKSDSRVAVVVLRAPTNDLNDIRPLVPALLKALETLRSKAITYVP
jgi:predicted nuclease of predicted toxin-antitoxin system